MKKEENTQELTSAADSENKSDQANGLPTKEQIAALEKASVARAASCGDCC